MNHFGHSVLNEYEAYHQCCVAGLVDRVDLILQGWVNFFPHADLYPELADRRVMRVHSMADAFRAVVEGRYMLARPTSNYWFSVGLGGRIRNAANAFSSSHPSPRLAEAKGRRPLIWFEIRSNDRRWVNQEEEIPKLVDHLSKDFPSMGIVLSGWSRMVDFHAHDERMVQEDSAVAARIADQITGVPVFDITGTTTMEKTLWAMAVDAYVALYGTGLIFPCYIGQRPGVVHTNLSYSRTVWGLPPNRRIYVCEDFGDARFVYPEDIRDANPEKLHAIRSHYLDWQPVYDILKAILNGVPDTRPQPQLNGAEP